MRIVLAALVALVFSSYYFLTHQGLDLAANFRLRGDLEASKDLLFVLFSFYLLIEGLLLVLARRGEGSKSGADTEQLSAQLLEHESKRASLNRELEESKKNSAAYVRQNEEFRESEKELKVALDEAKARLEQAQAQAQIKQRSQAVDAELVNLISLFQEKGRLIDFLMDDVTSYADQEVGAAARVVHQGCAEVLKEYFKVGPVDSGAEGQSITLDKGFDPNEYRLVGKISGDPPFTGRLVHRGWKTLEVRVPRLAAAQTESSSAQVIAPAEIDLT